MKIPWIILIIFGAILSASSAQTDYNSTKLCIIDWYGRGYSLFSPKVVNDPGTLENSHNAYVEPARGPNVAILDTNENIIIASRDLQQLVGFNNSGGLIFNYSYRSCGYSPDTFDYTPDNIYVDSQSRLYIQTAPGLDYIPILNYKCKIIEKIRPFSQDRHAIINLLNWAPEGTLFFRNPRYGWVTYANGKSIPGGSGDFYASDSNFYHLYQTGHAAVTFERSYDPDSFAVPATKSDSTIVLSSVDILSADLLKGGSGEILYVLMRLENKNHLEIWQFDLTYKLLNKLAFPDYAALDDWRINPFIGRDGNIYEFKCLKDGLHVVRWSRK